MKKIISVVVFTLALSSALFAKEVKNVKVETFVVKAKKVAVHAKDSLKSKKIAFLKKGEKIEVIYCNKFGWCKLKNGGYVAKFLLKPVKK